MMTETTSLRDLESLSGSPEPEMPLTVSPSDTSLDSPAPEEIKEEEKKPAKKRKSWGQELPVPKTNLPPRYVLRRETPSERVSPTVLSSCANINPLQETSQDRR